ncbi:MAG: hypothetical protein E6G97_05335 [Alphaproteobacteria bacterium]|nr:MAG: hypothetical protein E6G97_05335 [Alphaproteobacteria bacterium]
MDAQDQLVRQSLDVANFATLAENAKKPVPNEAELRSLCDAANRERMDRIRSYARLNPDSDIAQANKHILEGTGESWSAGPCSFNITSAYGWAVGGGVPFGGLTPLAFLFGGKGTSWKAWASGTVVIGGSFSLDPNAICLSKDFRYVKTPIGMTRQGPAHFDGIGGGFGPSVTTVYFYSNGGTYWGTLMGTGLMAGYFEISRGQLELVWQGWKEPPG